MSAIADQKNIVRKAAIVEACVKAGLKAGDVILVHSAMRPIGQVENGAETVVDALLEVVGPGGTLVAPAFTFYLKKTVPANPVIDPQNDASEAGAISEAVRLRPNASRSTAFRHSFAAIGRRARVITSADFRLSPFDLRSAFGVMLALNTKILLLGVTYESNTTHHFCEWLCDVPYRETAPKIATLRSASGETEEVTFINYQPKPGVNGRPPRGLQTDFNRLGRMLETSGKVKRVTIGNAVTRQFAMRDLCDLAQPEAAKDYNVFLAEETEPDQITPLVDGEIVVAQMADPASRKDTYLWLWSVVDPGRVSFPAGVGGLVLNKALPRWR